jgi:protein TonB
VKAVVNEVEAVNVKEEAPPPEEPPPPPPKDIEIPPYVPPPEVTIAQAPSAPTISTQSAVPQPEPPRVAPPAPAPAPPPAPAGPTTAAAFDKNSVAPTPDDYPPASLRANEEGVSRLKVTVGLNGRIAACEVTQSSGFQRLDEAACKLVTRRGRAKPALMDGKPVEASQPLAIRWVIPKN